MHTRILFIVFMFSTICLSAQGFIENFGNVDSLFLNGWVRQNNSSPAGSGSWRQDFGNFTAPFPPANSSIVADYTSIASGQTGDISNWLMSPTIQFTPGDSIIFYTISYQNSAYPDRLELRLNRSNTTDVGTTTTSVGDFDTLLLEINPTLVAGAGGYPMVWTRYACRIDGVAASTPCRIGWRYFVTNGGQSGTNGSTIGIDHVEYKSTLIGIEEHDPLVAYVQLQNGRVLIEIPGATHPFSVEMMDISGKLVHAGMHHQSASVDVGSLAGGVYLVKIVYEGKYLIKKISF
jgi:hypothetical protein